MGGMKEVEKEACERIRTGLGEGVDEGLGQELAKDFAKRLILRLARDFPSLRFCSGRKFAFRPPRTIFYVSTEIDAGEQDLGAIEQKMWRMRILHEVGHAALGHRDFATDVERLKMERAAWEKAKELYETYKEADWGEFDDEEVENELDSYRDWLHQKSKCPECGLTRYQTTDKRYHCPRCEQFC